MRDEESFLEDNDDCFDAPLEICHHCGKDRYDFSDLGCIYCDGRVEGFIGGANYDIVYE